MRCCRTVTVVCGRFIEAYAFLRGSRTVLPASSCAAGVAIRPDRRQIRPGSNFRVLRFRPPLGEIERGECRAAAPGLLRGDETAKAEKT